VEERVFILKIYLKTMSYVHCRQFFFKFRRQTPVKSAIAKIIKKFRETGSLLEKNRNQQKSVLTPGILQDIQTAITRSPHKSLRKDTVYWSNPQDLKQLKMNITRAIE